MASHSDEGGNRVAIVVGVLALAIIAAPFTRDVNTGWYVLSIGVGMVLLVVALSLLSPPVGAKNAIFRRGG